MKVYYIGDNRNRGNFGCRGTSMALYDIIASNNEIISVLSGEYTDRYRAAVYGEIIKSKSRIVRYWEKIRKKLGFKPTPEHYESDFISQDYKESVSNFLKVYSKYEPLKNIMESINNADAIMLNGEGTFIFRNEIKYEFLFYFFILALAQHAGKKTYVLNAMFSDGSVSERNKTVITQAKEIFGKCTLVVARDILSYNYYKAYIDARVEYVPDALFTWTKYASYYPLAINFPLVGISFPEEQKKWVDFDFQKPYIVVSAASREYAGDWDEIVNQYAKLVLKIKEKHHVIILETCEGEPYMREVAEKTNTKFIDIKTNILFGMSILVNAQCFVSGRWHPSILASLGGTPCVMLGSNSHKSKAIYAELNYNEEETIFGNPPSDRDIANIISNIQFALKMDRKIISNKALCNSNTCMDTYAVLLK